jgi:hypothetical protein
MKPIGLCRLTMSLTGELGIFYEDLYHLVKPLHEVIHYIRMLRSLFSLTTDQHKHHNHADDRTARESPTALDHPWQTRGITENDPLIPPITAYSSTSFSRTVSSSSRATQTPLHPACRDHSPSLLGRVSADLIPFAAYLRGIFSFYRPSEVSDTQPVRNVLAVDCEDRALIHIDTEGYRYRQSGRHSETLDLRSPGTWPESWEAHRERR